MVANKKVVDKADQEKAAKDAQNPEKPTKGPGKGSKGPKTGKAAQVHLWQHSL